MKRSRTTITSLINVFLSAFTALLVLVAFSAYADHQNPSPATDRIYPVVNSLNSQESISKNGLGGIFKMRLRQWKDDTPVTVYVLKDGDPIHKQFCKQILHVFPHQMRRIWNRAVFSGSGQAPNTVKSIKEMITKISNTPGAIGYLQASQITDDMKILEIHQMK